MAYTYLVGWSKHDVWYYGVRTAKTAEPGDLWKTYFTSSHRVKAFREANGEPDVVEIRRVFSCRDAALRWEERVIDRLDAVWSPRWLNAQNAGRTFNSWPDGRPRSEACREKIRARRMALLADPGFASRAAAHCKEFTSRPEVKSKISEKALARYADPDWKAKWLESRQDPAHRQLLSERTKATYADPLKRVNHDRVVSSPSYRAAKAEESRLRNADPAYRERVSSTMKEKLSDPAVRAAMSERAKASTAKRLASREANKQAALGASRSGDAKNH